jgi:hypothetical protein
MKTPVKTIFEQFHFNQDFPKWLAENKESLIEFERFMLSEFYWFMLNCDAMNIHQAVDEFLKQDENN